MRTRRHRANAKRGHTLGSHGYQARRTLSRRARPNLATGKAAFIAAQKKKGRSPAQAAASWKFIHARKAAAAPKTTKRAAAKAKPSRKRIYTRTYGAQRIVHKRVTTRGGVHTLVGHVGGKKFRTALYRTRKGGVRHVPHWAIAGFPSEREYLGVVAAASAGDAKASRRRDLGFRRVTRIVAARERASAAASKRIMAGRDPFVPNRATLTNEEREMLRNSRRRRRARRARTHMSAAEWKKVRGKRAKTGKRTGKRAAAHRRSRSRAALAHAKLMVGRARKSLARVRVNRRRGRRARYNTGFTPYRHHRRSYRRSYRRNAGIMGDVKTALKFGAIAFGGYVLHSALTTVLDQQLAKVQSLSTGAMATWRPLLSGTVVAAALIPIAAKVSPRNAGVLGAGVAVSFLKRLAYTLLGQAGDTGAKISGYLSAYPDASGMAYRGYGSYFTVAPRQVYSASPSAVPGPVSGYGDYYETANINVPYAGYGGDVMQAAAGYGAPLMQAAAGMGAPLMQAAAGMGEYEVVPDGSMSGFGATIDGIAPNLSSAEQSLNVMEAAAGFGDLSLQSMINPMMTGINVPTDPGGSRAGLLAGSNGLFGG